MTENSSVGVRRDSVAGQCQRLRTRGAAPTGTIKTAIWVSRRPGAPPNTTHTREFV